MKMHFRPSQIASVTGLLMAVAFQPPALAQQSGATDMGRVEVTGSRLKTIVNEASSPVAVVSKAEIDVTQPVAVEELIRGLPASYPAIGPGINNGSNGTDSIDLRGLGSNRTLVLVNSKRFVPATLGGVVDTNNVPISLLERVDVVTGGASAVYGADAVAGVVNFVTKRSFSGIEATSTYSMSGVGDALRRKNDVTMGANLADDRGNVVLHIGTTHTDPIRLADRSYSVTALTSTTGLPGGFSGTAVPAIISGMPAPINGSRVIDASTGLLRAAVSSGPPDGYNTNPPNYFETPLDRTQLTGMGRFKINDYAEAYAELYSVRSNVTLNLAPSGTFGVGLSMPIGNPYIPDAVRQQLCSAYAISAANCVVGNTTPFTAAYARRFVEAGPRIYSYDNTTMQYTAGVRGDIPMVKNWAYDAYYSFGRSEQIQTTGNGFSFSKLQQAANAVSTTNCVVNTGGCVPINLFGSAGSITPAMLAYLSVPTYGTTLVEQTVVAGSANGEIEAIKSPMAKSPLNMAFGYENRKVYGGNKSDSIIQTQGELLGSGSPTPDRNGTLTFSEYYTEAKMPLLQDQAFAHAVNLEAGYRQTSFSTSLGGNQSYGSWKYGMDWSPIKALRFRGEQQLAIRAPNVNELYAPVTTGLSSLTADPCQLAKINAGDAGKAGTLTSLCQATGVPTSQIGSVAAPSSSQINNTSGGNPDLGPEKAQTTTLGIVWEPDFVSNLSITLDYWKIAIDSAASSPTAGQVISGCFDPALNPGYSYNVFCQLIQRDRINGGLNGTGSKGVITQASNLGVYDYNGIDVGVNYRLMLKDLGAPQLGKVDFSLQVSHLTKADFKALPSVPTLEQAGRFGVDVGMPYSSDRFTQRAMWSFGDYMLGYNWRYIGGTTVQNTTTSYLADYTSIKPYHYVDLNGSWQVTKNLKVALTINNAFDVAPPIIGTGIGPSSSNFGNTFPMVYDVIGRRYTFTAQANF